MLNQKEKNVIIKFVNGGEKKLLGKGKFFMKRYVIAA